MNRTNIFEVNMSPTYLKRYAAKVDAKVGIEYELLVPRHETEVDKILKKKITNFDQLKDDILEITSYIGDPTIIGMITRVADTYLDAEIEEEADDAVTEEHVVEFLKNNPKFSNTSFKDLYFKIAKMHEEEGEITKFEANQIYNNYLEDNSFSHPFLTTVNKHYNKLLKRQAAEEIGIRSVAYKKTKRKLFDYDKARKEFISQYSSIGNLLKNRYRINFEDILDSTQVSLVEKSFSTALGLSNTETSHLYHGAKAASGYRIEPDTSIKGAGIGLEFISPPLTLAETEKHLVKTVKWAQKYGCTTNESTGLHINVSVPNMQNLDYIKLIVLLGDKHVLEQFDRSANTFTIQSLEKMHEYLSMLDHESLKNAKRELISKYMTLSKQLANELIESSGKYVSVRFDPSSYIEFRSPGGDWLNHDIDNILATVNRFVSVLSIACDQEAFKEDYRKKFYTMITQNSRKFSGNPIMQYVAGLISGDTVKRQIAERTKENLAQLLPQVKVIKINELEGDLKDSVYIISKPGMSYHNSIARPSAIVLANSEREVAKMFPKFNVIKFDVARVFPTVAKQILARANSA